MGVLNPPGEWDRRYGVGLPGRYTTSPDNLCAPAICNGGGRLLASSLCVNDPTEVMLDADKEFR